MNETVPALVYIASSSQDEDEHIRRQLEKCLHSLVDQHCIHLWHRQQLPAGRDIRQAQKEQMEKASIILLLMSADFLNECDDEIQLAASYIATKHVLLIRIRAVNVQETDFEPLLALPRSGPPLADNAHRDQELDTIAHDVRTLLHIQPEQPDSLCADPDSNAEWAAIQILRAIGTDLPIQYWRHLIAHSNPEVRQAAAKILDAQDVRIHIQYLLPLLHNPDITTRQQAIHILNTWNKLLPTGDLLPLLHNATAQHIIVQALEEQSAPLDPDLLFSLLHDPDSAVRQIAIRILDTQSELLPIDALLSLLADADATIRLAAVQAIGQACNAQTAIDALLPLLEDPDALVQQAAIIALNAANERFLVEHFQPLLSDFNLFASQTPPPVIHPQDQHILSETPDHIQNLHTIPYKKKTKISGRQKATILNLKIQGEQLSIDALFALLYESDPAIRQAAITELQTQSEHFPIERLLPLLEDPDTFIQQAAIQILGSWVRQLDLQRLLPLLQHDETAIRQAAIAALREQGTQFHIKYLLPLLTDPDLYIREGAIHILGNQNKQAILKYLLPLLDNPDETIRRATVESLKAQTRRLSIPMLRPFLYRKNAEVRLAVAEIIQLHHYHISSDVCMDLLSDKDSNVREVAVHIIKAQDPQLIIDLDLIPDALATLDGQVRGNIFQTLTQLHLIDIIREEKITFPPFLEKLTELLDWPYWQVRMAAAEALGQLRYNIPDVTIQRLHALRNDPDPKLHAVREAAKDALSRIIT